MKGQFLRSLLFFWLIGYSSLVISAQSQSADFLWNPDLDQPIEQLEEVLSTLSQQQPMNYTIANISFLYDAKLYILFKKYLEKIPASKRPSVLREQNIWLAKRRKSIDAIYDEYGGGTLAPYDAGQEKINMTKSRIKDIEEKLRPTP